MMMLTARTDLSAVSQRIRKGFFRKITLVISLIVMLGWCFCGKQEVPESEPETEPAGGTVCAVMFFQNRAPDTETDWIGRGIAQLLSLRLSRHDRLEVVRHARLETILRIMGQQNITQLTDQVLLQAAGQARATRAVLGEYHLDDGGFQINARLVDVPGGAVLATEQVRGAGLPDLFRLTAEIAGALESGLDIDSDPGLADLQPTGDIAVYEDFIRGLEAFRQFDTPEGMAYLHKAISADNEFALAHASQTLQAYIIGDLPRAIAAVSHTSSRLEQLPETQRLMIKAIEENLFGNYDQSFDIYQRLREKVSPDPEIYLVLGQMFYAIRDYTSAEKIYRDLLRQDPENVTAHMMLGLNLLELGQPDLAQVQVDEALRLKTDHPYAHITMSRISAYRGNTEEAEHHLRQASLLDPMDPWIHNQLGYFYLSQNKSGAALKEFQRYVELAPDDPNAHDSLAEGYLRNGQRDLAEKEYLRALELKPDFDNPHFMLARLYEDRGEKQKAIRMFQRYLQISPRGPRAKEAEARLENLTN